MSFIDPGRPSEEIPIVAHIVNKICQILPSETGSPYGVEDDEVFINARSALIQIAKSDRLNDILKNIIIVLRKLNEKEQFLALKQRSIPSLASILIILRLLADVTKVNWDYKEPTPRNDSVVSISSTASNASTSVGYGSFTVDYHTVRPTQLDSRICVLAVQLISKFKSTNTLTQEHAFINGRSATQTNRHDDFTTKSYIDQIDLNCEAILRFLAAANPEDFLKYTTSKTQATLRHNIYYNEHEFATYLELFASVYLDETFLHEYLKHLKTINNTVKRSNYRQLVFQFFLKSINIWIHSRPCEFLHASEVSSNVSIEADALMDDILNLSDNVKTSQQNQKQFKTSYKFLAFLAALNPSLLEGPLTPEFKDKKSSLKKLSIFNNSNKKKKLSSNIVKSLDQPQGKDLVDNSSVLENLDFVVFLANVAGSIYNYDQNHPIVKFSLTHYDVVSRVLVPLTSNLPSPLLITPTLMDLQQIADLRLTYYSNICVLNSQEVIPQLFEILNDETSSLETINITVSVLRVLTFLPNLGFYSSQSLIVKILPALRRVMLRMALMVKSSSGDHYYDGDDIESASLDKMSIIMVDAPQYKSLFNDSGSNKFSPPSMSDSVRSPSAQPSQNSLQKPERPKELKKSSVRHQYSTSNAPTVRSFPQNHMPIDDSVSVSSSGQVSIRSAVQSREVLLSAFGIFKRYPYLYLASFNESNANEKVEWLRSNSATLLEPLTVALADTNFKLNQAAIEFINAVFSIRNIPDDLDICASVFIGSAIFCEHLARSLLVNYSSHSKKKDLFENFVKALESRIALHSILENYQHFEEIKLSENVQHSDIASTIEEFLIFCLCTADREIYPLIKKGLKYHETELSIKTKELGMDVGVNRDFFLSVANENAFTSGQVALQKNIRNFFLKINTPSPALSNIWNRIYDKWYHFAHSDLHGLSQVELVDYRNFGGFLASTVGVFIGTDSSSEFKQEYASRAETFIKEHLLLVKSPDLVTREHAKEILVNELSPKAYVSLVRLMTPHIEDLEARKDSLTEVDFICAELIIVLSKACLDKSDQAPLFVISVEIMRNAEGLARIVDSLPHDPTGLKLRVRLTLLFYKIELHREDLQIQSIYKDRNKFLRLVFRWFDQAVSHDCDCEDLEHQHSISTSTDSNKKNNSISESNKKSLEYLYIDLANETSKTLSQILDSLILESAQAVNEEELKFTRSRIFNSYFSRFIKALERYTDSSKFRFSVQYKLNQISDNIVACLTNLLKANVDTGLSYALKVGYHTNLKIRLSFLNVFVAIIQSYAETTVITEKTKRKAASDLFLLFIRYPKIISAIGRACPASDAPGLAAFAVSLTSCSNQSSVLVSCLVEEEILHGSSYTDILRRNSFASRSLSAFGRIRGNEYLVSTLKPILTELKDFEGDLEVEKIDVDDPAAQTNLGNFMYFLTKLINEIVTSELKIPPEFKKSL